MKNDRINNKLFLAENSSDIKLLEILSKHKRSNIRRAVASNQLTPTEIIWGLIKDNNIEVQKTIAERHNLPYDIYQILFEKNDHCINVGLANNSQLPKQLQFDLIERSHYSYGWRVASKTRHEDVIDKLLELGNPNGRPNLPTVHILRNKNLKDRHYHIIYEEVILSVYKNEFVFVLLQHMNVPSLILKDIVKTAKSNLVKTIALKKLGKDLGSFV